MNNHLEAKKKIDEALKIIYDSFPVFLGTPIELSRYPCEALRQISDELEKGVSHMQERRIEEEEKGGI